MPPFRFMNNRLLDMAFIIKYAKTVPQDLISQFYTGMGRYELITAIPCLETIGRHCEADYIFEIYAL